MRPRLVPLLLLAVLLAPGGLAAQDCPPQLPSPPRMAFKHTRSKLLVATQGQARHRGQDVLVTPGRPQRLVAKFAYGQADKDLKDEPVDIFIQRRPPCGEWTLLATRNTTTEGEMGTVNGIADDGGRIFYEIPEPLRLPVGRYPVRMRVVGDRTEAAFDLVVVPDDTRAVVFDIDGTLTTHDKEVTKEYLADLVRIDYKPQMFEGAPELVRTWSDAGFLIVYLTGRPDFLRTPTAAWLIEMGFPDGAIHLADSLDQFLPTSNGVARYKREYLAALQELGVQVVAAYGNAVTDIEAYNKAGIDKSRTCIIGPHAGKEQTVPVKDYPSHLKDLKLP